MSLILRIDVDKSYGRATFLQKAASKIAENYWLPSIPWLGYLHDLNEFLEFLSLENINAHIYFRKCSLPPRKWLRDSVLAGHKIGLHAENTMNFDTFRNELEEVQKYLYPMEVSSFTKHGSGQWKSGRHHYPLYEPEKYLEWADQIDVPFLFGNSENIHEMPQRNKYGSYYPGAYWIDRPYSNHDIASIQEVVTVAKERNLVVLIHCADFLAMKEVNRAMKRLVSVAKEQNVMWRLV